MDGDRRELKIEQDVGLKINTSSGQELIVTASHDSIQVFCDPSYNHLRYYDPEDKRVKLVLLEEDDLATLVDEGIPITLRGESITSTEHQAILEALGGMVVRAEAESYIDTTVESAHDAFDAEASWYMQEWLEGRDGS